MTHFCYSSNNHDILTLDSILRQLKQNHFNISPSICGPVGQSSFLQIKRSRVRFLALPDLLSSGSRTGCTQLREYN
jgi:hypothetical protein